MVLSVDIGNSALKAGIFEGDVLIQAFRIPHEAPRGDPIRSHFERQLSSSRIERAAISSVVPSRTEATAETLSQLTGADPLIIGHALRLPIRLTHTSRGQLGTDRIAAAAAGWALHARNSTRGHQPVLVIDAGTAVTLNLVDSDGLFRGGMIWAGPDLIGRALAGGTALLPFAEGVPLEAISSDTAGAIRSGIFHGFIDGVDGMIRRISADAGPPPYVLTTGGRGNVLAEHLPVVERYDPHLVIRGVNLILNAN